MARKGEIEIPIAVDTGNVEKSIQNGLIDPIEDAEDALKALSKVDAGKDIDREMGRAQKATEEFGKELDETRKDLDKLGYAAKEAGADAKSGLDKAKAGAQEVQQEFGQNMGEAVSSFRGSIEDIGQIGQDTLGGLAGTLASMGGLGAAAGAGLGVAAAAVGVITDAYTKARDAADDARESAYNYGITVAESGKFADAAARINEYTGSVEGLKKVQDLASATGWEQVDVVKALATGEGIPALTRALNDSVGVTSISSARLLELGGVLDGTAQGFALAKDGADIQATALFDLANAAGTATGEVDDLGNAIVQMPDGKQVLIDAKTGKAYEDIDALERKQLTAKTLAVNANTFTAQRMVDDLIWRNDGRAINVTVNGRTGSKAAIY